jgi:hypothetical protein
MTATVHVPERIDPDAPMPEKQVDEAWQARAMQFVVRHRKKHGVGPTWNELWTYMGWHRKRCGPAIKMQKLRKRGLVYDETPRSLDVTEAGRNALRAWWSR